MTVKNIKRSIAVVVCAVFVICTAIICNAAGSNLQIEQLDNMTVQLPDNMLGITRDSQSTDKYFSVFGLDYDKTMSDFKSSDIFMQAMDNQAETTVTVTMTRNGDSEGIKNYNRLSDEKLYEVRESFISQGEYISCTPDQVQDIIWLMFDLNITGTNGKIKAYQANTVYDGMSINVTIQRNGGNVTSTDYQTLHSILSTVAFNSKAAPDSDFTVYVYIGIAVLVVVLFIIVTIAGKKAKKKNKKTKNDKILRELTDKYKSEKSAVKKQNDAVVSIYKAYDEINASNNNINSRKNENDLFDDYRDIDEEEIKVKVYEKATVSDEEIDKIVNENKARFKNESTDVEVIETKAEKPEPEKVTSQEPLQSDEEAGTTAEQEPDTEETKDISGDDVYENAADEDALTDYAEEETEEQETEDEEELRREAEKNTADDFDEGYDFFEEKPRRIVGIIDVDSSDLKNAVDYDVLSEEEKRAVEVETDADDENDKTESFIRTAERISAGIKNFFVHCGYFCTNVSRLIKRKHAAKKRKKAEIERRERERVKRQQTAQRRDKNGLVKVHSAAQGRPHSQSIKTQTGNQPMRKAPSRRPQHNDRRK